jgi:hypothetical protein
MLKVCFNKLSILLTAWKLESQHHIVKGLLSEERATNVLGDASLQISALKLVVRELRREANFLRPRKGKTH